MSKKIIRTLKFDATPTTQKQLRQIISHLRCKFPEEKWGPERTMQHLINVATHVMRADRQAEGYSTWLGFGQKTGGEDIGLDS